MTCSIVTVDRQLTAVVRAKVPFAEIPNAQRAARAAVDAALPALDAGPIGRPLTRFRTPAKEMLEMEMGTIVGRSFAGRSEIVPSELPAGRAAHFQHKDADHDGRLSWAEFSAGREPVEAKKWFDLRDVDGDGFVSRREFLPGSPLPKP